MPTFALKLSVFGLFLSFLAFFPAGPAVTPASAAVADTIEALSEKALGPEDAPITIIEYASLTCPHCAKFHGTAFPQLKKEYIDTGKVRFIYRDFPLDAYALKASMLARCSGNNRYFKFLKVLFKKQENWTRNGDPLVNLQRISRLGGISLEDFKVCLGNKALEDGILKKSLSGGKKYKVDSTPTIIINEEKYTGDHSFEELDKHLRKLLP